MAARQSWHYLLIMMDSVGISVCVIALFVSLACLVGAGRMIQSVRNSGTITLVIGLSFLTLSSLGALMGGVAPSLDYWSSAIIVLVVGLGFGSLGLLLCFFGGFLICVRYIATAKRVNELEGILSQIQQRMDTPPPSSSPGLKS